MPELTPSYEPLTSSQFQWWLPVIYCSHSLLYLTSYSSPSPSSSILPRLLNFLPSKFQLGCTLVLRNPLPLQCQNHYRWLRQDIPQWTDWLRWCNLIPWGSDKLRSNNTFLPGPSHHYLHFLFLLLVTYNLSATNYRSYKTVFIWTFCNLFIWLYIILPHSKI